MNEKKGNSELICEAIEILTQKKLLSEEDNELSKECVTAYMTKQALLGNQIDQMDCMMSTAFIMGWIKAKRSISNVSKPKISLVEDENE